MPFENEKSACFIKSTQDVSWSVSISSYFFQCIEAGVDFGMEWPNLNLSIQKKIYLF